MLVLKDQAISKLNAWIKEFCDKIQNNCDEYSFYRADLYSNSNCNICMDFMVSDIEGRFRKPAVEYDPATEDLFYEMGSKFNFASEDAAKKAIRSLVEKLETFPYPISRVLFDFNHEHKLVKGYAKKDLSEPGSMMLYLEGDNNYREFYNYSEGIPIVGIWLAGDWGELLKAEELKERRV